MRLAGPYLNSLLLVVTCTAALSRVVAVSLLVQLKLCDDGAAVRVLSAPRAGLKEGR